MEYEYIVYIMKLLGSILFTGTIIIVLKSSTSKFIGKMGEHWTKQELKKLPKEKYQVINDVYIKINNTTHQIDHIVVSPYGIFSIETKQYNGYITGKKYDKNWVRHIGKKEYYYLNPIRQNYGHVKALAELLKIDEKKIYNIVCIPSRAKLRIQHDGELVRNWTIVEKILSYKEEIIENPNELVKIIQKNNITDKHIKKEHIENIKNSMLPKDLTKCPRCGGELIVRNGKYGSFLGCKNYPKCKYTRKNNE